MAPLRAALLPQRRPALRWPAAISAGLLAGVDRRLRRLQPDRATRGSSEPEDVAEDNGEIWLMDADGGRQTRLVEAAAGRRPRLPGLVAGRHAGSPTRGSPGRPTIRGGGDYDIWIANADGSGRPAVRDRAGVAVVPALVARRRLAGVHGGGGRRAVAVERAGRARTSGQGPQGPVFPARTRRPSPRPSSGAAPADGSGAAGADHRRGRRRPIGGVVARRDAAGVRQHPRRQHGDLRRRRRRLEPGPADRRRRPRTGRRRGRRTGRRIAFTSDRVGRRPGLGHGGRRQRRDRS